MRRRTCRCCEFFEPNPEAADQATGADIVGECRRRCPTPRLTYEGRHCEREPAVWPRVWGGAWCGEFVARSKTNNTPPGQRPASVALAADETAA